MKKLLLSLILCLSLVSNVVTIRIQAYDFEFVNIDGSGSVNDPYLITDAYDLAEVRDAVNEGQAFFGAYFKQTDYLYLTDVSNSWIPIGTEINPFKGNYDGDGWGIAGDINVTIEWDQNSQMFTVSDVTPGDYQDDPYNVDELNFGLFGYTEDADISNVYSQFSIYTILVSDTSLALNVGGLIGKSINTNVSNIQFSGNIRTDNSLADPTSNEMYAGGIIGYAKDTEVSYAIVDGETNVIIESTNAYTGGLFGWLDSGNDVSNCAFIPYDEGFDDKEAVNVGWLTGAISTGNSISHCYSSNTYYEDANYYGWFETGGTNNVDDVSVTLVGDARLGEDGVSFYTSENFVLDWIDLDTWDLLEAEVYPTLGRSSATLHDLSLYDSNNELVYTFTDEDLNCGLPEFGESTCVINLTLPSTYVGEELYLIGTTNLSSYSYTSIYDDSNELYFEELPDDDLDGFLAGPVIFDEDTIVDVEVISQSDMHYTYYSISVAYEEPQAISADASLSSLVPSSGTLSSTFDSSTESYTLAVTNSTSSITLTPTVNESNATVKVNGTPATSGIASSIINLPSVENTITVVVTAEDGTTRKTYTIKVIRGAELLLSRFTFKTALVTTEYDTISANKCQYSSNYNGPVTCTVNLTVDDFVSSDVSSHQTMEITPTALDSSSIIQHIVTGSPIITSGSTTSPISLGQSYSQTFSFYVYPSSRTSNRQYNLTINGTRNADATLSSLVLSTGSLTFSSSTETYSVTVPNSVTSMSLTPTMTKSVSTMKVDGVTNLNGVASSAINLSVGSNSIPIVVTAEDGSTTKTYTVNVTREAPNSTDSALSGLSVSSGTLNPTFSGSTTSYSWTVGNSVNSIEVTPTVNESHATVKVNGVVVASGSASSAINLSVGSNSIPVVVTAQDGTTISTYTLTVTREAPNSTDSALSGLSVSSGTLNPTFSGSTTSYSWTVGNSVNSIEVTPTVNESHATVKVNGVVVTSGSASSAINLSVGSNSIPVVVTAQDGTTISTYTLTVTREAAAIIPPETHTQITTVASAIESLTEVLPSTGVTQPLVGLIPLGFGLLILSKKKRS